MKKQQQIALSIILLFFGGAVVASNPVQFNNLFGTPLSAWIGVVVFFAGVYLFATLFE